MTYYIRLTTRAAFRKELPTPAALKSLEKFIQGKSVIRYRNCVLIFRHVYDRNRPEREYRDHDSIELNTVVDTIAMFFPMEILNENTCLKVEKVLARVDKGAVQALGDEDIFITFPAVVSGKAKTRLVLKKLKTESSIRKVWIPATLAKLLRSWKESQDRLKSILVDDYYDYNLVIALENGRP